MPGRVRVFATAIRRGRKGRTECQGLGQSPNKIIWGSGGLKRINKSSSDDRPGPGICESKYVEDAKAARSVRVWDRVPIKYSVL